MKMTSNETSFALLKLNISEDVDAYVCLRKCIKNCGWFPNKPADPSRYAAEI